MNNSKITHYYSVSGKPLSYHHEDDAGIDLPIWDSKLVNGEISTTGYIDLEPQQSVTLKTGVHLGIQKGHYGFLDSRSSTSKLKLDLLCRIIDNPFRGNIRVAFTNTGDETVRISNGDELFQIVIQEYSKANLNQCFSLDEFMEQAGETTRGSDGFGSKERNRNSEGVNPNE